MDISISVLGLLIVIISILIAMTVHEATHAYVGLRLGDTTAQEEGRISLNPLNHIDPFMTVLLPALVYWQLHAIVMAAKPVPFNPYRVKFGEYGAALIAASGPLSNLAMAIIAALLLRLGISGLLADFLLTFITINVALFIFNLVPIPPLDGSRVLYAFAPEPLQEFMQQLEPYGFFIVIGLVLLTGFGSILLSLREAVLHLLLGV